MGLAPPVGAQLSEGTRVEGLARTGIAEGTRQRNVRGGRDMFKLLS